MVKYLELLLLNTSNLPVTLQRRDNTSAFPFRNILDTYKYTYAHFPPFIFTNGNVLCTLSYTLFYLEDPSTLAHIHYFSLFILFYNCTAFHPVDVLKFIQPDPIAGVIQIVYKFRMV